MNITLPAPPGRTQHPPEPASTSLRVGLLDRLALHLGVALVTWSRRPRRPRRPRRTPRSRAELVLLYEQRRAQISREHEDQLRLLRSGVWRP